MRPLIEYIIAHTQACSCRCEQCITAGPEKLPNHGVDMVFFDVSLQNNPDPETLKKLISEHDGDISFNPMDGKEHSYIEVGFWLGDQGFALRLMGLGKLLGLWKLMTPKMIGIDDDLAMQMAGAGYVSIVPDKF